MIKHDPSIREDKIWEDFAEKGVCPEIKNLEDYRQKFHGNGQNGKLFLAIQKPPIVNPPTIQRVHETLFAGIYPWAGLPRKHNIMCRGRAGAPPDNILPELEILETQVGILMTAAKSKLALNRIAAFQHARLTTIQAFGDGNSRTSRAITETFLTAIHQKARQREIDRLDYFDCLEAALGEENLAPLSSLLSQIYGGEKEKTKWIPAPFRTSNLPLEAHPIRSLPETLRQKPEIINEAQCPQTAYWLAKWTWEKVADHVGGKPTETEAQCQRRWEENRKEPIIWENLEALIQTIQQKGPFKKPLFGPPLAWTSLLAEIQPKGFQPKKAQHPEIG